MKTLKEIMASDIVDVLLTDFAEGALYTPAGGDTKTIKVTFDNEYVAVKAAGDAYIESCGPAAYCKDSDITGAKHNDTLVINSITYYVIEIHPDGTGMTTLILSKDQG